MTAGMVEVTKDQFFAFVGPRNVHPTPYPDHSLWRDLNTHSIVGKTQPGYRNTWGPQGKTPAVYLLTQTAHTTTNDERETQ
jgi:hypothetical protein